jgi:hypothetical protein
MSYVSMDHADWVQRNIAANRRRHGKKSPNLETGWHAAPDTLSPFQRKVFDILGIAGNGIYNAPISWQHVRWKGYSGGISIPWRGSLSTFDFMQLTHLVFLCHEARVRCEIEPANFRFLRLIFHPRLRFGDTWARHPDLHEAVNRFRAYLPTDHPIHYGPATEQDQQAQLREERLRLQHEYETVHHQTAADDGMPVREAA